MNKKVHISKNSECVEIKVPEEKAEDPEDNMKNGEFVIPIIGEIGWEVTAESIITQLKKADGIDVVFEISSPGGSIIEGVEIFNAIRNYEGKTESRIMGLAASMGSYITLAADKVLAEDNSTYMIHNAKTMAMGDADEIKKQAEDLDKLNTLMAQEYIKKTGKSEKEILKMMDDETWLFGQEIKDEGFIDEMIIHEDPENKCKEEDKEKALIEGKNRFKNILQKMKNSKNNQIKEVIKMKKMSKFIKLSNKVKESLPDSSFAVILNGKNDSKIRKLPYMDADGKVDVPHLRNAIRRISEGKIELKLSEKKAAMKKLKAVAEKYLKLHKNTRSGKIIKASISKFEIVVNDRLNAIIEVLRKKAENKKPEEEISFSVKNISDLIQDLKEIVEMKDEEEETDEDEDKKEEAAKKEAEDKKKEEEDKKEEEKETEEEKEEREKTEEAEKKKKEEEEAKNDGKETEEDDDDEGDDDNDDEEEEEESKFKELVKVCEGYKKTLDVKDAEISKFNKKVEELEKCNKEMTKEISKFKTDNYTKILKKTVECVSKFRGLNEEQSLRLKGHYLTSKMSESALEEISRKTEYQLMSKMGTEPKEVTKPTEYLNPAEEEKEYSKMSKDDQLDMLAKINAQNGGFVQ